MPFLRSVYWEQRRGAEDALGDVDCEPPDFPESQIVIDRAQSDAARNTAIRRVTSSTPGWWVDIGVDIALRIGTLRDFSTDDIWPDLGPPPEGKDKRSMAAITGQLQRQRWAEKVDMNQSASVTRHSGYNSVWRLTEAGRSEAQRRR